MKHLQNPSGEAAGTTAANDSAALNEMVDAVRSESSIGAREVVTPANEASTAAPVTLEGDAARPLPRLLGRLHYIYSLSVAGLLLLVLGGPGLIPAWILKRPGWIYPFASFGARAWLALSGVKVRVIGYERLDPNKIYVFAANHRSYYDTAAMFGRVGRRVGVLAKKELLRLPVFGWGMDDVDIMAIDRSNRTRAFETVRAATDRIRSGRSFAVFAEGRRALPGEMLPFKKGAFYMARDAGVDVVPVAIKNTDLLMGKGTGVSRPGMIEIVILPAIPIANVQTDEDVERLTAQTRAAVAAELNVNDNGGRRKKSN